MKPLRHTGLNSETDLALIRRARMGDERAFTRLVHRYEDSVYRFAVKVCRDGDRAEETLQDTFVNVYRKLKQFDGKAKFSTWLYRIVANNCLMKHRRSKLALASVSIDDTEGFAEVPPQDQRGRFVQTIPSWKESPLEGVVTKELRTLLDRAIEKLPVDFRAVFVLRDIEGRPAEEAARILGISVAAAKSRLHRARMFLRNELNDYMKQP